MASINALHFAKLERESSGLRATACRRKNREE